MINPMKLICAKTQSYFYGYFDTIFDHVECGLGIRLRSLLSTRLDIVAVSLASTLTALLDSSACLYLVVFCSCRRRQYQNRTRAPPSISNTPITTQPTMIQVVAENESFFSKSRENKERPENFLFEMSIT